MKVRVSTTLVTALLAALTAAGVVIAQRPPTADLKFGELTGAKEHGGGDPQGFGTASGTIVDPDTLCYGFTVKGIGHPVAAHIHRGRANQNGPIVIPLKAPATGDPGKVSGCVSGIPPADGPAARPPSRLLLEHPHHRVPGRRRPRAGVQRALSRPALGAPALSGCPVRLSRSGRCGRFTPRVGPRSKMVQARTPSRR